MEGRAAASTVVSQGTWRGTALNPQQADHPHHALGAPHPLALGAPHPRPLAAWTVAATGLMGMVVSGQLGALGAAALAAASSAVRRATWPGTAPTRQPARQHPAASRPPRPLCATTVGRRATTRASAPRALPLGQAPLSAGRAAGGRPASTVVRRGTWRETAPHQRVVGVGPRCLRLICVAGRPSHHLTGAARVVAGRWWVGRCPHPLSGRPLRSVQHVRLRLTGG